MDPELRDESPPATFMHPAGTSKLPPVGSPSATSQEGGSSNGVNADVAKKTKKEVDHLLAKLEKVGVQIDDKVARIIDVGIARIKAEAVRETPWRCTPMALHSHCDTCRWTRCRRDSPLAGFPPPTAEDGSSNNGANADVASKAKEDVDHLLAKLEKLGVEIDDKIACIIDDGIGRIKAQVKRENIIELIWVRMEPLLMFVSAAIGFVMGVEKIQKAFCKELTKRRHDMLSE